MRIIIDVDGDLDSIENYLKAIEIDRELIRSIKFEQNDEVNDEVE